MSPFTDDDVRRLKEHLSGKSLKDLGWFKIKHCDALLVRLEAAEDCIDDHRKDCLHDIGNPCSCAYQEKLDAWKNAAGK